MPVTRNEPKARSWRSDLVLSDRAGSGRTRSATSPADEPPSPLRSDPCSDPKRHCVGFVVRQTNQEAQHAQQHSRGGQSRVYDLTDLSLPEKNRIEEEPTNSRLLWHRLHRTGNRLQKNERSFASVCDWRPEVNENLLTLITLRWTSSPRRVRVVRRTSTKTRCERPGFVDSSNRERIGLVASDLGTARPWASDPRNRR